MGPRYLLTGAGFTHNFGAPLAAEIWSHVLNHPRVAQAPELRRRLLTEFDLDFEWAYQKVVLDGGGATAEQGVLREAVVAAYRLIDDIVREYRDTGPLGEEPLVRAANCVTRMFGGSDGRPGYIFTLNQDLLFERRFWNDPPMSYDGMPQLRIPGFAAGPDGFTNGFANSSLDECSCEVPYQVEIDEAQHARSGGNEVLFVKLHGSCNWRRDGSKGTDFPELVIGRSKDRRIQEEPLLRWYWDLFQNALSVGGAHLLVIGYGFGDEHVNKVLADAIRSAGLTVHVMTPQPSKDLRNYLSGDLGRVIWNGLGGYFQGTLRDHLPWPGGGTAKWMALEQRFFGRKMRHFPCPVS